MKRVLLKVSGETCCPAGDRGIVMDAVHLLARQIREAAQTGVQIGLVMGGGNILRGSQFKAASQSIQAATAHTMGMLATIINGLAIQDALESLGQPARLLTAVAMESVADLYTRRTAIRHLERGRIVLLAGGTGSPYVTTDTAAAQRAIELGADILLKATKVDGVYSDDPEKNPNAIYYPSLSYEEFLAKNLRVLDQECIAKCKENQMPIRVFNYRTEGNLVRAVHEEEIGTLIR
ncbi:MAG: UMP kinase [Planctomycetaceae bacterium]|nr:UMP kinase [Planctomycetaceae bacterium]